MNHTDVFSNRAKSSPRVAVAQQGGSTKQATRIVAHVMRPRD